MKGVIMGLVLPAAWSRTPGSSQCNELVMETVAACASGKITALSTVFRNKAGTIRRKVPKTEVSGKSMFQVHEARTETVKQNSSWQQQEDCDSGVFQLENFGAEIRLHWKQNVHDFLRNSARPVGHQIRAAYGWSVKVSAWVDAISTFIEFVTGQGYQKWKQNCTTRTTTCLRFVPISFLGFVKAPSTITIKWYHKNNVLELSNYHEQQVIEKAIGLQPSINFLVLFCHCFLL